jgi:hypothetical protein
LPNVLKRDRAKLIPGKNHWFSDIEHHCGFFSLSSTLEVNSWVPKWIDSWNVPGMGYTKKEILGYMNESDYVLDHGHKLSKKGYK